MAFDPPRRIEYRITKGSPIRDHLGVMEFSPLPGGGSHLDYRIRLGSPIPGVALAVKTSLTRSISKSLGQLDARAYRRRLGVRRALAPASASGGSPASRSASSQVGTKRIR